jgi:hypothetical protein
MHSLSDPDFVLGDACAIMFEQSPHRRLGPFGDGADQKDATHKTEEG